MPEASHFICSATEPCNSRQIKALVFVVIFVLEVLSCDFVTTNNSIHDFTIIVMVINISINKTLDDSVILKKVSIL